MEYTKRRAYYILSKKINKQYKLSLYQCYNQPKCLQSSYYKYVQKKGYHGSLNAKYDKNEQTSNFKEGGRDYKEPNENSMMGKCNN